MFRRQEATAPKALVERLPLAILRHHHHERRQVVVQTPQPITHPGSKARPARKLRAGLEHRDRRIVIDRLREHRLHKTQVIHHPSCVRQQFANPRARASVLCKVKHALRQRKARLIRRHSRQSLSLPDRVRQVLTVHLGQHRFVIEALQLRRAATHEQVDHPLGLGSQMRGIQHPSGI